MIHGEAGFKATMAALDTLRTMVKSLGANPRANLLELDHLRRQLKDMELEIAEYEHHSQIPLDADKKDG